MRVVVEEFLGERESARYEPDDFRVAGDRVVMAFTTHFRGRVRLAPFREREEALAATGVA